MEVCTILFRERSNSLRARERKGEGGRDREKETERERDCVERSNRKEASGFVGQGNGTGS